MSENKPTGNDKKLTGRLTSFHEMIASENFQNRFESIVVPKIQRDYAQGREGKEQNRQNFLNEIFTTIDSDGSTPMELNFIYGKKVSRPATGREFLPVDGQQRLTTLFLLHLYIAKRIGESVDSLKAFSYEVRESSKDFCKRLIEIDPGKFRGIKSYVEDQWWCNTLWKNDPTIHSMLVVLNDIDAHYKDMDIEEMKKAWHRLTKGNKITFWQLDLEDLETTDDLYIKMNSRGKPLTEFEHFKAEIERIVRDFNLPADKEIESFATKIDTDWTYLLWDYRDNYDHDKKKYFENGLDTKLMTLFRKFLLLEGLKRGIDTFEHLRDENFLRLLNKIVAGKPEIVRRFVRIMNFFYQLYRGIGVKNFFLEIFTAQAGEYFKGDKDETSYRVYLPNNNAESLDIFAIALTGSYELLDLIFLEAIFEYADSHSEIGCNLTELRDKIRVVRNLAINSRDERRAERLPNLVLRTSLIMKDTSDIDITESQSFRQSQLEQEKFKLQWLAANPDKKWNLYFAENHSLLIGDVSAYLEEVAASDNDGFPYKFFYENLMSHARWFVSREVCDMSLIESLMLTYSDYGSQVGWQRWYGGSKWETWRRDIFSHCAKETGKAIRNVENLFPSYDADAFNLRIKEWLGECREQSRYPWRYYLVSYPQMRDKDASRYYQASWEFRKYDYQVMARESRRGWYQYVFLWEILSQLKKIRANLADIPERGGKLMIKRFKWTVSQKETGFEIAAKEGREQLTLTWDVTQWEDGTDREDRIEMFMRKFHEEDEARKEGKE